MVIFHSYVSLPEGMSMVILVNDQPGGFDYGAVVLFEGPEMEPRAEYSALPLIVEKVGTGGVDGCEFCRKFNFLVVNFAGNFP